MNVQFQERDLAFLLELGEVGLLDTDMIYERHYDTGATSGKRYLQNRLKKFCDAKLLEPIKAVLNEVGPRKIPNTYRVTVAGADVINELTGTIVRRPARSDPPKPDTIRHRLGVVRTRLAIDDAYKLRGMPAPLWIMEKDTNANFKPKDSYEEKFILAERYSHAGESVVCRPDASAVLQLPGSPPWNLVAYFEYDRSTEGEEQICNKMPGYQTMLHPSNAGWRNHWPCIEPREFARVIFVCKSQERIGNICNWTRNYSGIENFRFVEESALQPSSLLTDHIWQTVDGELKALLPT